MLAPVLVKLSDKIRLPDLKRTHHRAGEEVDAWSRRETGSHLVAQAGAHRPGPTGAAGAESRSCTGSALPAKPALLRVTVSATRSPPSPAARGAFQKGAVSVFTGEMGDGRQPHLPEVERSRAPGGSAGLPPGGSVRLITRTPFGSAAASRMKVSASATARLGLAPIPRCTRTRLGRGCLKTFSRHPRLVFHHPHNAVGRRAFCYDR